MCSHLGLNIFSAFLKTVLRASCLHSLSFAVNNLNVSTDVLELIIVPSLVSVYNIVLCIWLKLVTQSISFGLDRLGDGRSKKAYGLAKQHVWNDDEIL